MDTDTLLRLLDEYSFDGVMQKVVSALAFPVGIIILMALAFFVSSWISGLRSGLRFTRRLGRVAGDSLRQIPRAWSVRAFFMTLLVWFGQALTLILCYLCGNAIAFFVSPSRQASAQLIFHQNQALASDPTALLELLTPSKIGNSYRTFSPLLRFDTIPQIYVTIAAFLIVMSYIWARRRENRVEAAGIVIGLPAVILLGLTMVAGIFFLLMLIFMLFLCILSALFGIEGSWGDLLDMIIIGIPYLVCLGFSYVYYWACMNSVRSSKVVVLTWKTDATAH